MARTGFFAASGHRVRQDLVDATRQHHVPRRNGRTSFIVGVQPTTRGVGDEPRVLGYVEVPFADLAADYPGEQVYPVRDFRVEWGPVFHRGRLDGTARVLVLGQDPATHETITRRILVGEAGQRVQGLLARVGITTSYVMVNTFLYSVYGQGGGTRHAADPHVAAYRHRWLDALLVDGHISAVITLGGLARTAFETWAATQPATAARLHHAALRHPTHPESASRSGSTTLAEATAELLDNWNARLPARHEKVHPDQPPRCAGTATAGSPATLPPSPKPTCPPDARPGGGPWRRERAAPAPTGRQSEPPSPSRSPDTTGPGPRSPERGAVTPGRARPAGTGRSARPARPRSAARQPRRPARRGRRCRATPGYPRPAAARTWPRGWDRRAR